MRLNSLLSTLFGLCLSDLRPHLVSITGQFYDYLHLLELTGTPSETHCLLMNGDLVDRGSWSIEVIVTALAFKCAYLTLIHEFFLLRSDADETSLLDMVLTHDITSGGPT